MAHSNMITAACQHTFEIPSCMQEKNDLDLSDPELLKHCREPCTSVLSCGHKCSGNCGECLQGRIHKCCNERCGVVLICGHECPTPCPKACLPCLKPCETLCPHSKCQKVCGQPCTLCTKPCTRKCKHVQCTATCGELCTTKPCTEPCLEKLPCGHDCVGFCGDPCPPLCRLCNKNDLQEIFLGYEEDENARFVLLSECNHIVESKGMEEWLTDKDEETKALILKTCPRCKTRLATTQRYRDYVKDIMSDVIKVKEMSFGTVQENARKLEELLNSIETTKMLCPSKYAQAGCFLTRFQKDITNMRHTKQMLSTAETSTFTTLLHFTQDMINIYKEHQLVNATNKEKLKTKINHLLDSMTEKEYYLTNQRISDIQLEITRTARMAHLWKIEDAYAFKEALKEDKELTKIHEEISTALFSLTKYSIETDTQIKKSLIELSIKVNTAPIITDFERKQIVHAMDLKQGQWFKCPNGHIYAIGECGGATEVGRCYECSEPIGGTSHRLLSTNRLASEMDGARYAAWSDAANLANYQLDDLQ